MGNNTRLERFILRSRKDYKTRGVIINNLEEDQQPNIIETVCVIHACGRKSKT